MLDWQELGGPPVIAPGDLSYGTSTIGDLIPYEFGGTVDLVFAPRGCNAAWNFLLTGLSTLAILVREPSLVLSRSKVFRRRPLDLRTPPASKWSHSMRTVAMCCLRQQCKCRCP